VAAVLVAAAGLPAIGVGTASPVAADPVVPEPRDGSTSSSAAPSCWSIKQNFPASADGVYWLWTPTMDAPGQFHCDMTTDGGGWVLIGRGREGWSFPYQGQDTAANLRTNVTGPAAFSPASLHTETVQALLGGGRVDELADGIRVRRAADPLGATWQEVRLKVKDTDQWSWALGGGLPLSSVSFNGTSYPLATSYYQTNTTGNVNISNDVLRMTTSPSSAHNYRAGFAYGAAVSNGSSSPDSYLWEYGNENSAIPFAQVFIRPQVMETDVVPASPTFAPEAGLPATTKPFALGTAPTALPWGVTGINDGTAIVSLGAHVTAFAQVGDTMYVGGKFLQVQHGPGGETFDQPYIAAFNRSTGEWIDTFRPVLDAPVWEMKASPDGTKLFVGGEFTSVNGQANTSYLAALDPATGAPVASWVGYVSRPANVSDVRSMDVQGNWLYVSGNFTRAAGGTGTQYKAPFSVSRLARFRLSDGQPDGTWKPSIEVAAQDLDASAQGDRVYIVGNFKTLNGVSLAVTRFAVLSTTNGQFVPGLADYQQNVNPPTEWLNTVLEVGDKVYVGGSQHVLHQYDRNGLVFERSHETKSGGDFQAITADQGILYASCHCNNWQYSDSNTWPDPQGYSQVNQVNYFSAYDIDDDIEVIRDFQPTNLSATGAGGEGPWELLADSEHCLWTGGDLVRGDAVPGTFYGGFERFCPRDASSPTAPTNLKSTVDGSGSVTMTWNASADDSGAAPLYEVLRDDPAFGTVVIGTTYSRSFVDVGGAGATRYFVRAADPTGNRSATTAALTIQSAPPVVSTLMAAGSSWSYQADGADLGTAWRTPGHDISSWPVGSAELGWGDGDEATVLPSGAVTQYFATDVQVADPAAQKMVSFLVRRDDGAVVYLNGTEIGRTNMPAGPVTSSTPAASALSGSQETAWVDLQVPASMLQAGVNRVAVEVHQVGAANGDGSFDLQILGRSSVETNKPSNVTLSLASATESAVGLSWTPSEDDQGVAGYVVRRDGAVVAYTPGTAFTDSSLEANSTHTYEVQAVDRSGNTSAWSSVTALTDVASVLVGSGDTWAYRSAAGDPPAGWSNPGFDVSSWPTGASQLGWGDGDEATLIPAGTLTQYFVRSFEVSGASRYATLTLRARIDDGAALYVNGVEVARKGLPAGALSYSTFANVSVNGTAESAWNEFTVPAALLHDGTNTVAAELHQNTNNNADATFDLELVRAVPAESNAPSAPTVTMGGSTGSTASLSWTASTDDTAVFGYVVRRDGQVVNLTTGTSFTDTGLLPATVYGYTVSAVDASGNQSAPGGGIVTTTPPSTPIDFGATWSYRFDGVDQGTEWQAEGFDDTSWPSGASELGIGDNDEATIIGSTTTPTPVTAYFRRTFEVDDPTAVTSLELDVVRDDGFVAYINGVEVARNNMPAGAIAYSTRPVAGISLRSDETTPVTVPVAPGVLHAGTNTIAVEMHQANNTSNDLSFSLRMREGYRQIPAVNLTSPAAGAIVGGSPVTVSGLCTAGIGDVTLEISGSASATEAVACNSGQWSASLALGDGEYTAVASMDDGLGSHPVSPAVSFSVDTTAPEVAITSPSDGAILTTSSPTISGSCSTGDAPVKVVVAGPVWHVSEVPCTDGSWSVAPALADEVWTVGATQADAAGNLGSASGVAFTVDTQAPVTADNAGALGSNWRNTPVTVQLSASDSGSGVAQTYYTIDGSTPTTSSPTGTSVVLDTDGVWTVQYFSVDVAGNVEPVRTAGTAIRIDRTAPAVAVTAPSNGGRYNSAGWTALCGTGGICGTVDDGAGAGVARVEVTVWRSDSRYFNGATWQTGPATVVAQGTSDWTVPIASSLLTNGRTYTVTVRSVDLTSNYSAPTVTSFAYDTSGPSVSSVAVGDQDGAVEVGDFLRVTYGEPLDPATVPSAGTLTLNKSYSSTSNTTYSISGLMTSTLTTGATGYIVQPTSGTRTVTYPGSITLSEDRTVVTFTVSGECAGTSCGFLNPTPSAGAWSFRSSNLLRDVAGNGASTSTITAVDPTPMF
jgi:chitodextrinase